MPTEPRILDEAEQPYVAVRCTVTMTTIGEVADRFPEVFGWLATHGIEAVGAPFFRYLAIDMDGELLVEAGVPVAEAAAGDGEVRGDVLPAGRYATVHQVGHPDELLGVTGELLSWGTEQGVTWDVSGARWGGRVERYLTDPREEPNMANWETELAIRLAD